MLFSDDYPPHSHGGAGRIAYLHATGLRSKGWDVGVITSRDPNNPSRDTVNFEEGIKVYRIFDLYPLGHHYPGTTLDRAMILANTLWNPALSSRLARAIADFAPQILHAHQIARISYGVFVRLNPKLPRFLTFHTYHFECPKGGLFRKYRNEICQAKPLPCQAFQTGIVSQLHSINRIIAISTFVKERLRDSGLNPKKIIYLPNGVPFQLKDTVSPPSKSTEILFVGRLEQNKGVSFLIDAFRSMAHQNATLKIVGDGPSLGPLKELTEHDSRILFTGWLAKSQLTELFSRVRMVVVPSICHEMMNTVVCEAQAFQRPVIATNVGGTPDMIEHARTGFLVPHSNVGQLASQMDKLMLEDQLADSIGVAGANSVRTFSIERHIERLESMYSEFGIGF